MIAFVEGKVRIIRSESVVVDTGHIGYEVFVPKAESYVLNEEVFLFTYEQIREDARTLFGFLKEPEYVVFTRLIGVKGIGCKLALNMLSAAGAASIIEAIETEDTKALKALPGIGAKTAGQIILDLRGKIDSSLTINENDGSYHPLWMQTQEALEALGYKGSSLKSLQKEFKDRKDIKDVNTMIREALKIIAKNNGM